MPRKSVPRREQFRSARGKERLPLTVTGSCFVSYILSFLRESSVSVTIYSGPVVNPLWETGFRQDMLIVPLCWKDILINAVTIPFEKEFLLPYGIFYRPEPHGAVKSFLEFIFSTYGEGNNSGIVPVLE